MSYYIMEQLLEQVEKDINKYGNVRPATLKKLEKVLKEHQVLEGKGIVSNVIIIMYYTMLYYTIYSNKCYK